jgi:hypothetical protein
MFLFPTLRSLLCQSSAVTIFFRLFLRRSYRAHIARIGWDKVPPLRQWLVFDSDGNLIRVRLQKRYERSGLFRGFRVTSVVAFDPVSSLAWRLV